MDSETKPLDIGGLKLKGDGQKKLAVVAGVITIVGAILWLEKRATGASTADTASGSTSGTGLTSSGQTSIAPSTASTGSLSTSAQAEIAALTTQLGTLQSSITNAADVAATQSTINLGFTTNNDESTSISGSNSGSGSGQVGGFLTGLLGIGVSGSSSNSNSTSLTQAIGNAFTSTVSLTNPTGDELENVEGWLTQLAGTSTQRANEANAASQQGYTYLNHAVSPQPTSTSATPVNIHTGPQGRLEV